MSGTDLINARLPHDLLAQVFHRVGAGGASKADLDSCALVCRRWCRVERPSRRAARVPVDGPEADDVVRSVAKRFPGLTNVTLDQGLYIAAGAAAAAAAAQRHGASNIESRSQYFTPSAGMQESHNNVVRASSLTDAGLAHLVEGCKRLEKLTLNWCFYISARGLVGIANNCQYLRSLELWGGCVQNHGLIALAEGCNLNDLKLCGVQKLTDEGLVEFLKIRGESLVSLDVSACGDCLTDTSLHAIGSYCRNLEVLSVGSRDVDENEGMISVAKGCQSLKSLKLVRLGVGDEALEAVGSFCSALEILTLDGLISCSDRGLSSIASGCKQLKKLILNLCNFTDGSIELVARNCRILGHLKISMCHNMETVALEHIGQRCMNLLVLSLSCPRIENNAFLEFCRGSFHLKSICLAKCSGISDEAICHIARGCKDLRKLCIMYSYQACCYDHGKKPVRLTRLTGGNRDSKYRPENFKFKIPAVTSQIQIFSDEFRPRFSWVFRPVTVTGRPAGFYPVAIGDEAIISVGENCKELRELMLCSLERLTDTGLAAIDQCCFLQKIHIYGCKQITDNGLTAIIRECHDLVQLDITDTMNIGDPTLAKVGEGCPKLKHLRMLRCNKISNDGLAHIARGCMQLDVCEVFSCPQVTPTGVATLVAGCPRLKRLVVEESKVSEETQQRVGSILQFFIVESEVMDDVFSA